MSAIFIETNATDREICLEGVEKPFRRWKGASGASYVFSAYDPHSVPHYSDAVYVVAGRSSKTPSLTATTSSLPELLFLGEQYKNAVHPAEAITYVHIPSNLASAPSIAADINAAQPNFFGKELPRKTVTSRTLGPKTPDVARLFLLVQRHSSCPSAISKVAS